MGDDIGLGSVTDCRLRSDSNLFSSTKLPFGKDQNKPFYREVSMASPINDPAYITPILEIW